MEDPAESSHTTELPHLNSSQVGDVSPGVQGVDILALVMNSDGLSKTKITDEELIAQRIAKRAVQKAEAQAKAERHKRMVTL